MDSEEAVYTGRTATEIMRDEAGQRTRRGRLTFESEDEGLEEVTALFDIKGNFPPFLTYPIGTLLSKRVCD